MYQWIVSTLSGGKKYRKKFHDYPETGLHSESSLRFDAHFSPNGQLEISIPIDGRNYDELGS